MSKKRKPPKPIKQSEIEKKRSAISVAKPPPEPDEFSHLTDKQKSIAEKLVEFELSDERPITLSVAALARHMGEEPTYVRRLFKRSDFQAYLVHLLGSESMVQEGLFWRGMAIGLSVGDPQVMRLYAQVTGKIKKEEKKDSVKIFVVGPDGSEIMPVTSVDKDGDIVEMEELDGTFKIVGPE